MPFGTLSIQSADRELLGRQIITGARYSAKLSDVSYRLCLGKPDFPFQMQGYRSQMLARGIYLGHNLGVPAKMHSDDNRLTLFINKGSPFDYKKLVWSFALKYLLTEISLKSRSLHLKAVTLIKDDKALLLVGRGNGGKTTLGRYLEKRGYFLAGNTHALIRDDRVWAINTWMRLRNNNESRYDAPRFSSRYRDAIIQKIIVVDHNSNGSFEVEPLQRGTARCLLTYFSAAVGNYDLKEDMMDSSFGQGFLKAIRLLEIERGLIEQLVRNYELVYISADVSHPDACRAFDDYLLARGQ